MQCSGRNSGGHNSDIPTITTSTTRTAIGSGPTRTSIGVMRRMIPEIALLNPGISAGASVPANATSTPVTAFAAGGVYIDTHQEVTNLDGYVAAVAATASSGSTRTR